MLYSSYTHMVTGTQHIPKRYTWIIGIDEAGRGPVAGPLSVGLVMTKRTRLDALLKEMPEVRDSKKISAPKREQVIQNARTHEISGSLFARTVLTHAHIVDTHGISLCLHNSVEEGIAELIEFVGVDPKSVFVLLDGSLKAPPQYKQQTIIKGDDKIFSIALASVYAKVTRDQVMEQYDIQYPKYNFFQHKGYGTVEHMKNIKEFGLSPIHRRSFLTKYII